MGKLIIDAHSHLWLKQDTWVDGKRILSQKNGRSIFMDEEVQMLPPFMIDGVNSAEVFLSNMDYAQVGGAVVVQEVIDGNQNAYLTEVQRKYPNRFFCMGMANTVEEAETVLAAELRGIAFPGHRLHGSLLDLMPVFKFMQTNGMVLSMCLGDNERQIGEMAEIIEECPQLKVAIGHFGMVTTPSFESQVLLARKGSRVMIESGGITWLFHKEFYPYPSAIRSILRAADLVGMDHLMWGSDYPRTITAITYKMSYDFVEKSQELTEEEKALFLGQNAVHFYGFNHLPDLPYYKNMSE
ncbi:MAG: amidohydrolase [Bacteroidaceae bacterium]|nr:amidohydrolase [Bacteroidaceae bacterium]